ncbi:MAG: LAGLIDADG family homing endonuclease [Candidatus Micrarchaeia archaeon]
MNSDIAYFIGVLHSDGYIYTFHDKKSNKNYLRIVFNVSEKSLPMIQRVQTILQTQFGKWTKIQKRRRQEIYYLQTSIKRSATLFNSLGIKKGFLPKWIFSDNSLFGSYLAGLIDGDGNICIKRPKHPQCRIKITDSIKQEKLKQKIEKILGCYVGVYYDRAYNIEFYVSKKNIEFVKRFIYPAIQIPHKKNTLMKFLTSREVI